MRVDIAHENDFYDIAQEVLKPGKQLGHNRKMIENLLSRFDAELGSEVDHLVKVRRKALSNLTDGRSWLAPWGFKL